jgi:hypothetical protein
MTSLFCRELKGRRAKAEELKVDENDSHDGEREEISGKIKAIRN